MFKSFYFPSLSLPLTVLVSHVRTPSGRMVGRKDSGSSFVGDGTDLVGGTEGGQTVLGKGGNRDDRGSKRVKSRRDKESLSVVTFLEPV